MTCIAPYLNDKEDNHMALEISLAGKVAVVTGAARGMGRAIALKFAEAGCSAIAVNDLRIDDDMRSLEKELRELGADVIVAEGDVSESGVVSGLIDAAVAKWGKIDILMNNAGIGRKIDLFDTTDEQWDRTLEINLKSVFMGMKTAGTYMKEQGSGVIINMASMSGVTGGSQGPDYSASKAGIIALTKFGAKTLGKYGIRVIALAPGYIQTELLDSLFTDPKFKEERMAAIPMGRTGTVEEVANVAAFLASDLASYVSGDTILITGGRLS
jgi:3-oxoacyl-[acyl-carrier protein] reductase